MKTKRNDLLHELRLKLCLATLILPTGLPNIEILGFRMVESAAQKRSLELFASNARIFKAENVAGLDNLRTYIWTSQANPVEVLGSLSVLDLKSQNFNIQKNAVLNSPDGYSFEAPTLFYTAQIKRFTTRDSVNAFQSSSTKNSARLKMSGVGFTADLNAESYEIHEKVVAHQFLSEENQMTVRSSSVKIHPKSNTATFNSEVNVKSQTLNMKGDQLIARFEQSEQNKESYLKFLEINASNNRRRISALLQGLNLRANGLIIELMADGTMKSSEAIGNIEALGDDGVKIKAQRLLSENVNGRQRLTIRGGVQVTTNNRVATCQEAIYFPDTGDITLLKVATVRNSNEVLNGDVIRFSTKGSEIIVEKARGQLNGKPSQGHPDQQH